MSDQKPREIAFESSYVLGLCITPYSLEMPMDLLLLPKHPAYQSPKAGERDCFKRGVIRISQFTKLQWNASGFAPATDATGEVDWGCLDEFEEKGNQWRLSGDWGVIEIEDGSLNVQLDES